jgi:DNA-binding transcriptional regulator YiaG
MTDTTVIEEMKAEATTPVAPKAPSKKSQALAIFQAKMADRANKLFGTNKEFRAAVLTEIRTQLGVSTASAATMYNAAKKEAEAVDASVGLGRDPKKEKVKNPDAKRGRPAGSKNKTKAESTETIVTSEPVVTTESAAATEATQSSTPAEAAA